MIFGESLKALASEGTRNRDWGREIRRFTQNFSMRQNHPRDPASHTHISILSARNETNPRTESAERRQDHTLIPGRKCPEPAEMEQIREASREGPRPLSLPPASSAQARASHLNRSRETAMQREEERRKTPSFSFKS